MRSLRLYSRRCFLVLCGLGVLYLFAGCSTLPRPRNDSSSLLVLAAEGTRGKGKYWKSGFYRMSQQTGLPISLGFVDGPSRTMGFGPTFEPTGDVAADMDRVRAFYADKHGIHPELRTEPRLRAEGPTTPSA